MLVQVLEDAGGFRPRGDVQRSLGELDAELRALRTAFPGMTAAAGLRSGSADEVLPSTAVGPALLVVGAKAIDGDAVRSPWSLGMRLLAGGRASVAIVPTNDWSWRCGVVAAWRGAADGAAVLFAAEEALARRTRLTLVAEERRPGVGDEAELVRVAFPALDVEVIRAAAPAAVLIGLARSAALVVAGADVPGEREPLAARLAASSEAAVAVIRGPRLGRPAGAPGRAARALF